AYADRGAIHEAAPRTRGRLAARAPLHACQPAREARLNRGPWRTTRPSAEVCVMGKGGPKTGVGKATVARNALTHGLLSNPPVVVGIERLEDWDAHYTGVLDSLAPVGKLEVELASRVAALMWRLRRATVYQMGAILAEQEGVAAALANQTANTGGWAAEAVLVPHDTREARELPEQAMGVLDTLERFVARLA